MIPKVPNRLTLAIAIVAAIAVTVYAIADVIINGFKDWHVLAVLGWYANLLITWNCRTVAEVQDDEEPHPVYG